MVTVVVSESEYTCRKCGETRSVSEFYMDKARGGIYPYCKSCQRAASKARYHRTKTPELIRERGLKARYGITVGEYDQMEAAQGGVCRICGEGPERSSHGRLHVDHCHETGVVRGLLCVRCNTTLGVIEAVGIEAFLRYLREP